MTVIRTLTQPPLVRSRPTERVPEDEILSNSADGWGGDGSPGARVEIEHRLTLQKQRSLRYVVDGVAQESSATTFRNLV